jgi:hypothetical protein
VARNILIARAFASPFGNAEEARVDTRKIA